MHSDARPDMGLSPHLRFNRYGADQPSGRSVIGRHEYVAPAAMVNRFGQKHSQAAPI
jgi:hypothetical protein